MSQPPRVLIVEDSSIVRRGLTRQLEILGATVTQTEDGLQGLATALDGGFDLIISDVEMPNLGGFALCERLKGDPRTRGVPVIILSSLDSDKHIEQGFLSGAAAYVAKREAATQLRETIERVLEKSRFRRSRAILVVEDSATIRHVVTQALSAAGFQVISAENGKVALDRIADRQPDLIISDINMPEMNGIDLCKAVRSDPALAGVPFVMMSGNSDRAIMRRLLQWGASSFLVKPFNVEQVIIVVERLLTDHFLLLLKEKERIDADRNMLLASITSLVVVLEARDAYTRGHSETVAFILAAMARSMDMPEDDVTALGMAGRLHDLGKIGVPDHVLLKPGRLEDDEFALIKKHPEIGAAILGPIPSLGTLLPVIRHHHERYDGKGYPDGLEGIQIPFWARMTAVADTYHALTSDRPYRRGKTHEQAMKIIEEVRDTQLCPRCVDVLKALPIEVLRAVAT